MKKIKVTMYVAVPEKFGRIEEKRLDMVLADTLFEEGYELLESEEIVEVE